MVTTVAAVAGMGASEGELYVARGNFGNAASWIKQDITGLPQLNSVYVHDPLNIFAAGNLTAGNVSTHDPSTGSSSVIGHAGDYTLLRGIYASATSTQATWGYKVPTNISGAGTDITGLSFSGISSGAAIGTGGKVVRTVDGGYNWTENTSGSGYTNATGITPAGDNHFMVTGSNGLAYGLTSSAQQYATAFYYDELGRLVASQNSKQYDPVNSNNKFSYTLYDELGRPVETGEATNTTSQLIEDIKQDGKLLNKDFTAWMSGFPRASVVNTYYDEARFTGIPGLAQQNLRTRVASVTVGSDAVSNTYDPANYASATHYSYDVHGNVAQLVQDVPELQQQGGGQALRYKQVDYNYDLVSNKVNSITLQAGKADQFTHRYDYDADDRLSAVNTSPDGVIWDHDAQYYYYQHGPLARMELGDQQVQGVDYAYTIQGWMKGMNSAWLSPQRDMGRDGLQVNSYLSSKLNSHFARDAAGFTLGYYYDQPTVAGVTYNAPDYQTVSGMENTNATSFFDLIQNITTDNTLKALHVNSLFNGNIRSLTGAISPVHGISMRGFLYDQANRLKAAATFTGYDNTNNKIDVDNFAMSTKYFEQFSYDGNGNIMTLTRNDQDGSTMDELAYNYYDGSNRLEHVENTSTSGNTNKVNTQTTNNYGYDHIGNMIKDVSSDIAHIDWNVQGKIWKIAHTTGSTHPDLEFKYDPMGHRLCKIVKHGPHQEDGWDYTYYVRDAQGQELATYTKAIATDPAHTDKYKATYQLQQNDLYGSKRLGVLQRNQLLTTATNTIGGHNSDGTITETTAPSATPVATTEGSYAHHAGMRYYELTNHLGNVLATIKDIKIPHDDNTDGVTDYYTASVAGANDYYSYGSIMPNPNNKTNDDYSFGFNGKRNDNEIKGAGNSVDFGERINDLRLGRWMSVDPLFAKYPYQSSYGFVGGNPILNREIDGRDYGVYVDHNTKTILIKATYYTAKGDEDSHTSAVQATQFWNEQSGKYQYAVGKGDAAINYNVQFELTVVEVDYPKKEINADRVSPELSSLIGMTRLTPDQSSNTYGVLPDASKEFENGEEGKGTNGTTKSGVFVSVKDSRKTTETGAHELGHTLGLAHFFKGLLTAASNDPNRSKSISDGYIKAIIGNAFKKTDEAVGKGTIHETGEKPEKFSEGEVNEKK